MNEGDTVVLCPCCRKEDPTRDHLLTELNRTLQLRERGGTHVLCETHKPDAHGYPCYVDLRSGKHSVYA